MYDMSKDEWRAFLSSGTKTGKLAVVRANGAPHVVPIWFVLDSSGDDDYVIFTMPAPSLKAKALRRDPRLAMCVDDERPPFSFVTVRAEAELSDDLDAMLPWATRLGGRYMGEDNAEAFGKRNAVEGELLVRARITKVIAQARIAD
ncbi:MAG TPA: PPOX class F420-dependent oxidoreductase [Pseudonocardiaceae bacterium]|jgi:PPOX class probable F420-dependent enzyme|nr:PPOX class F420-dependent oxidoreductase [Pseudonocardiaceae bacterium]